MNNKKVLYKFGIIVGLLCNSDIKSAEGWIDLFVTMIGQLSFGVVLGLRHFLFDQPHQVLQGRYAPPEGVGWLDKDKHPLWSIFNKSNRILQVNNEFTEKEKELIIKNRQYLHMLSFFSDNAANHFDSLLVGTAKGSKNDFEFLLKQGVNPNCAYYWIRREGYPYVSLFQGTFFEAREHYHSYEKTEKTLLYFLISMVRNNVGHIDFDYIRLALEYGADPNKGITVTTDTTIKHESPLTQVGHLLLEWEKVKHAAALLIAYGANIEKIKKELLRDDPKKTVEDVNKRFKTLFADGEFKQYLQEEREKRLEHELSKQVGVAPGTVSTHRMLQMKKLGARPGIIVPGFNYK